MEAPVNNKSVIMMVYYYQEESLSAKVQHIGFLPRRSLARVLLGA